MLKNLHVQNLALIEDADIEFSEGLNILTGETGAGKSLLMGSVMMAMGSKFDTSMIRKGTEQALVELVFDAVPDKALEVLKELDIYHALQKAVQAFYLRSIDPGYSEVRTF